MQVLQGTVDPQLFVEGTYLLVSTACRSPHRLTRPLARPRCPHQNTKNRSRVEFACVWKVVEGRFLEPLDLDGIVRCGARQRLDASSTIVIATKVCVSSSAVPDHPHCPSTPRVGRPNSKGFPRQTSIHTANGLNSICGPQDTILRYAAKPCAWVIRRVGRQDTPKGARHCPARPASVDVGVRRARPS